MGLTGMRERAVALGGRLELESEPGRGTLVRLRVPVAALLRQMPPRRGRRPGHAMTMGGTP
ncbi:hypothetical protein GBA63_05105 [Rubrobacter tropicus]|uniref:Histidine kinase/HSP90-like ATPase domain-containing protein n=2 Tax=Rubrobacter tropicus TaxID=2653851 RepID=A0A6G8Q6M6_9ACTN|nr:hypothetical protein GBA63_05105 [Rubrobacter tropicus]